MSTVTEDETTSDERPVAPLRVRYRIRFAKTGLLRWTSHRDLARLWERLVRRAQLKLSMTEGFHPKPRIAFPSALALGVEGLDEVVELELAEEWDVSALLTHLREDNQPGLEILSVARLPEGFGKAQLLRSEFTITIPTAVDRNELRVAIDEFLARSTVSIVRKNKTITLEVATQVLSLQIVESTLNLSLAASDSASLKPNDVLDLIGAGHWIEEGASIKRCRVALAREFETDDTDLIAHIEQENKHENIGDSDDEST